MHRARRQNVAQGEGATSLRTAWAAVSPVPFRSGSIAYCTRRVSTASGNLVRGLAIWIRFFQGQPNAYEHGHLIRYTSRSVARSSNRGCIEHQSQGFERILGSDALRSTRVFVVWNSRALDIPGFPFAATTWCKPECGERCPFSAVHLE
jgi:hypothetical protein